MLAYDPFLKHCIYTCYPFCADIALSAAHCERIDHPFGMRVFMLSITSDTGLYRTIEQQVSHPLYDGTSGVQDYDFMLLKLHTSALVQEDGQPTGAGLMELNRDPNIPAVGDTLVAMGFGKTDPNLTPTSPVLNEVEIEALDDATCLEQYKADDFVAQLMFCAGVEGGGKDTCQGDSGGPIIHKETGTQVGAVSFGIGCAQANYAGANSRISTVTEWIDDQICELSDNPPPRCGTKQPEEAVTSGPGMFSINIQYDGYPQETAWILNYIGTAADNYSQKRQLSFSPYHNDQIAVNDLVEESFTDMPVGRYSLQIGDEAGDGTCCQYGEGIFQIVDESTGRSIWTLPGDELTKKFTEAFFDVDATTGELAFVGVNDDYENSWEKFEPVNHPPSFDQQWPGEMPVADSFAVTVNVKYDNFPAENSWEFQEFGADNEWTIVEAYQGTRSVRDQLAPVEINGLSPGWYRFVIQDSSGDGMCCKYRRGWASLTAPLIIGDAKGMAWGNNGEYGSEVDVYVFFNDDGLISQVSYSDPTVTTIAVGKHSHIETYKADSGLPENR